MALETLEIRGTDPISVAGLHPLWKTAVDRLGPWDRLDSPEEARWISRGCTPIAPILVYPSCASTMDLLKNLREQESVPEWTATLAVEQTGGKGQRGRTWMSPPGNLYAAWHWPSLPETLLPLAPFIIAIGTSEVIEYKGLSVQFKWPNDILIGGKKAAGILIHQTEGESIVGVGVNLVWAPENRLMQLQGAPEATSLSEYEVRTDPLELWMEIVDHTREVFSLRPEEILARVEKRLAWIGQTVMIQCFDNTPPYQATLIGIAEDGALVVHRDKQETRIYSASLALE